MRRRYLYVLLFGVPILLGSTVISFAAFGAAAGFVWLFVAGDNPWSSTANAILVASFCVAFAASSLALAYGAYTVGKKQETYASFNPKHALAAVGATALLLIAVVSYQWRVGNIGPKSDAVLCSEFCADKGYAGSGMPPRNAGAATCSCFDTQGREAMKVPMQDVVRRK